MNSHTSFSSTSLPTHHWRIPWPSLHSSDQACVNEIRASAEKLRHTPDQELARRAAELRVALEESDNPHRWPLTTVGSLALEAVRRTSGRELFDVQLLAGLALARGNVAQMQTGEGKTLSAVFPTVVHALRGRGVHVATVNSYLASRDYEELRPAFELLGLTVGLLEEQTPPPVKQQAYACDITYGTGYEFGFDFLRDRIAVRSTPSPLGSRVLNLLRESVRTAPTSCQMQRGHALAMIDEADSVLLDEATTPLVIALPSSQSPQPQAYRLAAEVAQKLQPGVDFLHDKISGMIELTAAGLEAIQTTGLPRFSLFRPWPIYVTNALRARHSLRRDVDYVVQNDEVRIVDTNTGRIFTERSWQDGLHQAVEVQVGVPVTNERQAAARISRQRFYQIYERLAGMTGTIVGEEAELREFYKLAVRVIPTRLPNIRVMHPDRLFVDADAKRVAVVKEIAARHRLGQPVLVGTTTIAESEAISQLLNVAKLPHELLNGRQDADEAALVAKAGQLGAITVATNMAGRGTDIRPSDAALAVGGLHVIGMQRHDSRRIDRQLAGRSARQGNPGSCQFFIAATDPLICSDETLQRRWISQADRAGEFHGDLSSTIHGLQCRRERDLYLARRRLHEQELWLNKFLAEMTEAPR